MERIRARGNFFLQVTKDSEKGVGSELEHNPKCRKRRIFFFATLLLRKDHVTWRICPAILLAQRHVGISEQR